MVIFHCSFLYIILYLSGLWCVNVYYINGIGELCIKFSIFFFTHSNRGEKALIDLWRGEQESELRDLHAVFAVLP